MALAWSCAAVPGRRDGAQAPAGKPKAPPASTLAAEVNGEAITLEALERRLGEEKDLVPDLQGLEPKFVHQTRRAVLERMIVDVLVEQEARRQGIDVSELRRSLSGDITVSDVEVQFSYDIARRYKGPNPILKRRVHRLLAGSEEEAKARIRQFVHREKVSMKLQEFSHPLRKEARITIHPEALSARAE